VLDASAPFTPGSFAELAGRLLLYAAGAAALVALGRALDRGGRRRLLAVALAGGAGLAFLGVLAVNPEAVRSHLDLAYAWIPAGAWCGLVVLAWRARRRAGGWGAGAQAELLLVAFLAIATVRTYGSFLLQPNPLQPPEAPYLLPFAAAFMAWVHLRVLPLGSRGVLALGAGWLALLVAASTLLVVGDARDESVTVSARHGELRARPADGPALQAAVDAIEGRTRPGDPVLLAPQMTALYVMTGRTDPLPQISLLPGVLADAAAERRAIASLDAQGVRLAITDRTPLERYHHGAFGRTFDRELARWLRADFRRTAVLRGSGPDPRILDLWQRRAP
jgi:hypothetical protein